MKSKRILFRIAIIASAVWVLATPLVYIHAAKERMLPGIGGEFFWPFMPALFWTAGIAVKDTFCSEEESEN